MTSKEFAQSSNKNSNMNKIIILGAGGHAKSLLGALESSNVQIEGLLDTQIPKGTLVLNHVVLGDESMLTQEHRNTHQLVLGIGNVAVSPIRKRFFDEFKDKGFVFYTTKHTSALIHPSVTIDEGTQVMAGAIIQPLSKIGKNVILNTGSIIEHDCQIGNHCHIAPGATLGGGVVVGDGSFIGLGAKILPKVIIGKNVTVGAGSVVIRDIPDGTTVAGVPAKYLKK